MPGSTYNFLHNMWLIEATDWVANLEVRRTLQGFNDSKVRGVVAEEEVEAILAVAHPRCHLRCVNFVQLVGWLEIDGAYWPMAILWLAPILRGRTTEHLKSSSGLFYEYEYSCPGHTLNSYQRTISWNKVKL